MELTTQQIYILLGIAGFELAGAAVIYWFAGIKGFQRGYRAGIATATDELEPQLHEMTARCKSAERLLTASQNEVRRLEDERAQIRRNASEAIEELTLQLADAQVLNDGHATRLRQAANNLDLAHTTWRSLSAEQKAADARALAEQLRTLDGWLKPQSMQIEAAA